MSQVGCVRDGSVAEAGNIRFVPDVVVGLRCSCHNRHGRGWGLPVSAWIARDGHREVSRSLCGDKPSVHDGRHRGELLRWIPTCCAQFFGATPASGRPAAADRWILPALLMRISGRAMSGGLRRARTCQVPDEAGSLHDAPCSARPARISAAPSLWRRVTTLRGERDGRLASASRRPNSSAPAISRCRAWTLRYAEYQSSIRAPLTTRLTDFKLNTG